MKKQRIKILRVVIGLNQGGVQQGVLNLFRSLDPDKYEPIACAIENTGAIGKEIEQAGFEVIVLGYKRQMWKSVSALSHIMRERQIDIVHASSYHPSLYARLAAIIARVPVILGYEHVIYNNKRMPRVIFNRLLAPFTDGFTAVGEQVANQVLEWNQYPREKMHVVHNGVDISRYQPAKLRIDAKEKLGFDPQKIIVGVVSRLDPEKGHRFLFDAIVKLSPKYDVQWIVVGTGRGADKVYQEARDRGIEKKVEFLGLRRDVPELLAAFDIYVFPTLQEGFPNSLLEAMASGCAVVASDFPGNLEVAIDQRNALIVPMRDSKRLTQCIEQLLQQPELAKHLGEQARHDIVENFSLQAYAGKMSGLYEQLCEKKGVVRE